ncbi:MAG: response regulator [Cyanobacteria bacterium P01_D01_bin.105]
MAADVAEVATQTAAQAATQAATVLVVEDTPSERALMSHYLSEGGYSVIGAPSGQEGLDKAIAQKPDVIVSDIVMPGLSGFELCRTLKRLPETSAVPVVLCSSKKQNIDRMWGMRQGAKAYLTKPYTKDELLAAVQGALL